jgi:hypothetical protein
MSDLTGKHEEILRDPSRGQVTDAYTRLFRDTHGLEIEPLADRPADLDPRRWGAELIAQRAAENRVADEESHPRPHELREEARPRPIKVPLVNATHRLSRRNQG